ncbi:DUF3626 domain-containing protein [Nocardioides zhouii]|uniref:DUF3626 domain-containing protein n=1 Tax=Nocardioides zhouii TaxID=1168729 RepID=A0A4Q2T396_9ACTN|nr:DUF3626 domain-containing protein [Nocardioides zhouii]RYC13196.1 DUF3626 domain-containing protein [Nocardioides zhouii]
MRAGIVLHFHPGLACVTGTVLEAIVAEGAYRSQWVRGTSNCGLTAHTGGHRWVWEARLFGRRYDDADPADRPVYGAWNRRRDPYGAAPRFGWAYLLLRPAAIERSTFCWPDSVYDPHATGRPERLPELCALADAGLLDPAQLPETAAGLPLDDPLNDYVEAHVHGGVDLARDVQAIVLDPSNLSDHRDTLGALADLGVAVETHPGYRVTTGQIDETYRSKVPVALARELGGEITPAGLAVAQRTGAHDPRAVKWLWHCLARFGRQDID